MTQEKRIHTNYPEVHTYEDGYMLVTFGDFDGNPKAILVNQDGESKVLAVDSNFYSAEELVLYYELLFKAEEWQVSEEEKAKYLRSFKDWVYENEEEPEYI